MKDKFRSLLKSLWGVLSRNVALKLLSILFAIMVWSYVISTNPSITRTKTIDGIRLKHRDGWSFASGVSIDYQAQEHLMGSIFLDYGLQSPQSHMSGEYIHLMTLGARVSVRL